MSNNKVKKSFFTTREAARILGVSIGTAQLWTDSGLLQAWKTKGGHRRITQESLESLLYSSKSEHKFSQYIAAAPAAPLGLRMMVVDDDPFQLNLYEETIRQWTPPVQLTTVDNAYEALLMAGRVAPDLLVVDLEMPGIDGFRMLKILIKAPEIRATRIVVVSGLSAEAIAQKGGLPEGIEVYAKPVPFDKLERIAAQTRMVTQRALPVPAPAA